MAAARKPGWQKAWLFVYILKVLIVLVIVSQCGPISRNQQLLLRKSSFAPKYTAQTRLS